MTKEEIFEVLKEVFAEIIPEVAVGDIHIDDNLKELGANSIDKADIIIESIENIGVAIPMIEFGDATTFREIIEIIYNKKNK